MSRNIIDMSSEIIGDRLMRVRKAQGLSQQSFAQRLDTSSGYISEVETGKSIPGGKFLLSLNREFDVDINWLLTGIGGAPPLAPCEAVLLEKYRAAPPKVQDATQTLLDAATQCGSRKAG